MYCLLTNAWRNITFFSQDASVTGQQSAEKNTQQELRQPQGQILCVTAYTHHVSQAHSPVVRVILHQRVVMRGEQSPAPDSLREFFHNCARYSCSIKSSCASAWRRNWEAKDKCNALLAVCQCGLLVFLPAWYMED